MTLACCISHDLAVGFFFQRSCHSAYLVALRPYHVWAIAPVASARSSNDPRCSGRVAASTIPGIEEIKLGAISA
jgi:hypothetical protein